MKNGTLLLTAENEEEVDWVRKASRFNLIRNIAASVGAPPNYIKMHCANGVHVYELTRLLNDLSNKLEAIRQSFLEKDSVQ